MFSTKKRLIFVKAPEVVSSARSITKTPDFQALITSKRDLYGGTYYMFELTFYWSLSFS